MIQFEFELIGIDEQIYDNFKTFVLEIESGNHIEIGKIGEPFINAKNIYSAIMYKGKIYYSIEDCDELNIRLQNILKVSGQDYRAITDDKIERLREIKDDMEKMMKEMESAEAKFEKMKSKKNKIVYIQIITWAVIWLVSVFCYAVYDANLSLVIFLGIVSILLKQLDRELIK